MKKNSKDSGNKNLLKRFAVRCKKEKKVYNDRTAIYNRCSSDKQDSLGWMENDCIKLCKEKNLTLIRCFSEKESATTDDRKEFKAMLKFCEEENIGNIVIYSYDRFTRTGDTSHLNKLREKGISIHAVKQDVDDQTASGRHSQAMYIVNAKYENEQRGEKIIAGQINKLRKGEWNVRPTIGYEKRFIPGEENLPLAKKQCFINETGLLIRQAFLWKYNENLSHVEIINRLAKMGLTLSLYRLTHIFRNPFYCGHIASSYLDGELIRGKHEPLISEEIFLKVNGIISESQRHGYNNISRIDKMPFKASVKCGICERPLTAYLRKEIYIYYKCPNKGCCVNVSSKKLQLLFETELSKFAIHLQLVPVIKSQLEATYAMLHSSESAREKPMKDELTRLKNELETMEFNLATSKITPDLFQKFSATHKQKIQVIEDELEILTRNSSNLEMYLDTALKYVSNILKMWQLLDCNGKVRLQKLIYPDGLRYIPENHALRTNAVNPIFSFIASISKNLGVETGPEPCPENEKLRQLYLRFPSSNFFWENLEKIAVTFEDFERQYSLRPESFFPQSAISMTGATPTGEYFYTSNLTGTTAMPDARNKNLYLGNRNLYTGTTNHPLFT